MTKRVIDRRKIDMLHRAVSLRQHGLLFILSSREILYSDTVGTVFVSPKFYYVLRCTVVIHLFSAQQYADRAICYRPSVCPSIRLPDGWISQKWWKLGLCNFIVPLFLRGNFSSRHSYGSRWARASNKYEVGKTSYFLALCVIRRCRKQQRLN